MHFFHDCYVGTVLVRQPGRSSCTIVHSGSRQLLHALFYLRNAEPLHPCSRTRGGYSDYVLTLRASLRLLSPLRFGSLHLLPWMACMLFLQEQKTVTKKITIFRAPLSFF